MKQRKLNMLLLGLTAVLAVGCVVSAAGTAWARYRINVSKGIFLAPQQANQLHLGQMISGEGEGAEATFTPGVGGAWEMQPDGRWQLTFAVANGTSDQAYAAADQKIRICLLGSPGIWDGEKTVTVKLQIPSGAEEAQTVEEITAEATRIQRDAPLYRTFGEGWVFTFPGQNGAEYSWLLPGGALSTAQITLVLEGDALSDPSLLQLQMIGY